MNYANEDQVTTKYVEDSDDQDAEQLRRSYLIAQVEEHLLNAARLAELAADKLQPDSQAKRRGRLRELASALRNERDTLRFLD